jgi:hypothetical protein
MSTSGPDAASPWWQRPAARYAIGVLVIVVAVLVVAAIPGSQSKTLSGSQLRQFGPICASSGHLVSVVEVGRTNVAPRRTIYSVHCSGGLKTQVVR